MKTQKGQRMDKLSRIALAAGGLGLLSVLLIGRMGAVLTDLDLRNLHYIYGERLLNVQLHVNQYDSEVVINAANDEFAIIPNADLGINATIENTGLTDIYVFLTVDGPVVKDEDTGEWTRLIEVTGTDSWQMVDFDQYEDETDLSTRDYTTFFWNGGENGGVLKAGDMTSEAFQDIHFAEYPKNHSSSEEFVHIYAYAVQAKGLTRYNLPDQNDVQFPIDLWELTFSDAGR